MTEPAPSVEMLSALWRALAEEARNVGQRNDEKQAGTGCIARAEADALDECADQLTAVLAKAGE